MLLQLTRSREPKHRGRREQQPPSDRASAQKAEPRQAPTRPEPLQRHWRWGSSRLGLAAKWGACCATAAQRGSSRRRRGRSAEARRVSNCAPGAPRRPQAAEALASTSAKPKRARAQVLARAWACAIPAKAYATSPASPGPWAEGVVVASLRAVAPALRPRGT